MRDMVASVKAAAPATAAIRRKYFEVTLLHFCGRSASFAEDGPADTAGCVMPASRRSFFL